MNTQDHMKIGRYHSWLENGKLRLYSHGVGDPIGFSCTLDTEETKGLLEFLSRHREDIHHALYVKEHQAASPVMVGARN